MVRLIVTNSQYNPTEMDINHKMKNEVEENFKELKNFETMLNRI